MQLIVEPGGRIRALYGEEIDLATLGSPRIFRASHVEPDSDGRWHADMRLILGPRLGPFHRRSEALEAEIAWLEVHWLLAVTPGRFEKHLDPPALRIEEQAPR
jgi:hypothetical protein